MAGSLRYSELKQQTLPVRGVSHSCQSIMRKFRRQANGTATIGYEKEQEHFEFKVYPRGQEGYHYHTLLTAPYQSRLRNTFKRKIDFHLRDERQSVCERMQVGNEEEDQRSQCFLSPRTTTIPETDRPSPIRREPVLLPSRNRSGPRERAISSNQRMDELVFVLWARR